MASLAVALTVGAAQVTEVTAQQADTKALRQESDDKSDVDAASQTETRRLSLTPKVTICVNKALRFLSRSQNEDGSVGSDKSADQVIAQTALCGMAFIESGSLPDQGTYARELRRCDRYVSSLTKENGFVGGENSLMYVHAYTLRFLAKLQTLDPKPARKLIIDKAVKLIVESQNGLGGWRYRPNSKDADVSVASCLMVALQAARRAGSEIPDDTVKRAVAYINRCRADDGGYRYTGNFGASAPARSAAAMAALSLFRFDDPKAMNDGFAYLSRSHSGLAIDSPHYCYAQYYLSIALRHSEQETFLAWYDPASEYMIGAQAADGSWTNNMGSHYPTACLCLALLSRLSYLQE